MLHYHGIAGFGKAELVKFLPNRHVLISFAYPDHVAAAAEFASSFILDNGAFSIYMAGNGRVDVEGYIQWCYEWYRHPAYDWSIIPDVIGGDEKENNLLIKAFPKDIPSAPVWHFYESLDKLEWLSEEFRMVCIAPVGGPNNIYSKFGTKTWWDRVDAAMRVVCDNQGRPRCKLHGLRLLDPELFEKIPLASADSSNTVQNRNTKERFGMYVPATDFQRAIVIADRVERHNSAPAWSVMPQQISLFA